MKGIKICLEFNCNVEKDPLIRDLRDNQVERIVKSLTESTSPPEPSKPVIALLESRPGNNLEQAVADFQAHLLGDPHNDSIILPAAHNSW